jgi:ABC-type polysaccharide/polyol phosphate export permease
MTHVIALFREGFTAYYPAGPINPGYALFVACILIFIGFVAERFFVRRWAPH